MSDNYTSKQKWLAVGALLVTAASGFCVYYTQSRPTELNAPLNQGVGEMLAEETAHLVGPHGTVAIVTVEGHEVPELKVQINAFQKHLKELGNISVKDQVRVDPGDNPKYRAGAGLSARHFLKIARKNTGVDALVSFIGAPPLSDEEIAEMKSIPKFIAETHSPEKLARLFQKNILQVAIVPRYEFPAPGPRKPRTNREWFDHCFQIVAATNTLPSTDTAP